MAKAEHKQLMVIEGGKGPVSPNWLRDMEVGSVFNCRPKDNPTFQVEVFQIEAHADKTSKLGFYGATGMPGDMWVDSLRFSGKMELVDILGHVPQKKEETYVSNRTDRPVDVDDDD